MASELIERDIYGGDIHITHNPNARGRAPRYVVTKGDVITKPKGVTTILGQTLSKDLMKWAVDSAIAYLREKLPFVTEEDLAIAADEYNRLRDAGGSTGTEAHAMVENFLKGKDVPIGKQSAEAQNAFVAFVKWYEDTNPGVINVEEVIYSLQLDYAGTYDCMLRIDGKVYLCDLKTTNASKKAPNGVYAENFLQLGAYALAHEEQRIYEASDSKLVKVDGLMVISAKKNGKLDIVTNEDVGLTLVECMTNFRSVKELHDYMKKTTDKLGGK